MTVGLLKFNILQNSFIFKTLILSKYNTLRGELHGKFEFHLLYEVTPSQLPFLVARQPLVTSPPELAGSTIQILITHGIPICRE